MWTHESLTFTVLHVLSQVVTCVYVASASACMTAALCLCVAMDVNLVCTSLGYCSALTKHP